MGNTETALKSTKLDLQKSKGEVHEDWNVCPGRLSGTPVTVFSAIHPSSSRKRMFMEKALQGSKIYRHPSILRFMDGGIVEKEVVVVTEAACPLFLHGIEHMSPLQVTAGLAAIIEALVFLHDKAGVSHNNVCASSIYITSDGSWKLWGLEYSCSFGELTRDHIEKINQYCSEKSLPPDDKSRISPAYQHSRDSYSLGVFVQDVIAPLITIDVDIPVFDDFLCFIKQNALHKNWNERPRLATLLAQPLFSHEFIKLRQDLNNILLLSNSERENFIKSLPDLLRRYSEEAVAVTYGPLILSRSFMLIPCSSKHLMPSLLTPKSVNPDLGLFCSSVYKETIVPILLKLFQVHDASVRKILLTYFHHYVPLVPKEVLTKSILPQVLLGIRDTDEDLVSATLRCLACLVHVLGADTVIGKNREQIFVATKPKSESYSKSLDLKRRKLKMDLKPVVSEMKPVRSAEVNSCSPKELVVEDIPERSSPDGGEVTDEDVFKNSLPTEAKTDENWSDWEEMNDQPPPPEIVAVLKKSEIRREEPRKSSSDSLRSSSSMKGSAMQLRASKKEAPKPVSQGLGEEYDIMSLKIDKKPDSELDLFADLQPKLRPKNFDLESMLIEASHQNSGDPRKEKLPSLSDTLAELHMGSTEEGAAWNDDEDHISLPSGDESVSEQNHKTDSPVGEILEKIENSFDSDWGQDQWD